MVDLDSNPTKLLDVVEIGKQMLITRGALTTFSIANDLAKFFAIVPALFLAAYPQLDALNILAPADARERDPLGRHLQRPDHRGADPAGAARRALPPDHGRGAAAAQRLDLRRRRRHRAVRRHQAHRSRSSPSWGTDHGPRHPSEPSSPPRVHRPLRRRLSRRVWAVAPGRLRRRRRRLADPSVDGPSSAPPLARASPGRILPAAAVRRRLHAERRATREPRPPAARTSAPTRRTWPTPSRTGIAAVATADGIAVRLVPVDLVTASGSGSTPTSRVDGALVQVDRGSRARGARSARGRALVDGLQSTDLRPPGHDPGERPRAEPGARSAGSRAMTALGAQLGRLAAPRSSSSRRERRLSAAARHLRSPSCCRSATDENVGAIALVCCCRRSAPATAGPGSRPAAPRSSPR